MPNPYIGNDDAAEYVDYYASSSMERDAVQRLYEEGCQRHREKLRKVEAELYPTRAPVVRSKPQIDAFLERVKKLNDKKRLSLIQRENEIYGQPTIHMDPARLQGHVKHMYDDQIRKIQRRSHEAAEIRGDRPIPPAAAKEKEFFRERESLWRPVATSPKRMDGKATLIYDSPRRRAVSAAGAPSKRSLSAEERQRQAHYFSKLSKPLRVHPKVPLQPKDGFNLYVR